MRQGANSVVVVVAEVAPDVTVVAIGIAAEAAVAVTGMTAVVGGAVAAEVGAVTGIVIEGAAGGVGATIGSESSPGSPGSFHSFDPNFGRKAACHGRPFCVLYLPRSYGKAEFKGLQNTLGNSIFCKLYISHGFFPRRPPVHSTGLSPWKRQAQAGILAGGGSPGCLTGGGSYSNDKAHLLERRLARAWFAPTLCAPFANPPPFVSRSHPTDDLRVAEILPLIQPALLMHDVPLGETESAFVEATRRQCEAILKGKDDRLLVVTGPCSIHDRKSAMEYGELIQKARARYGADLEILMRVYFEKPRTTVGWKGFINDPHLDESYDINTGLRGARGLLIDLARMQVPAATEFLDVITPQYIADAVAWGAIGARTTESQVHRQLASGLSMPVGFKNGTDGSIQIALDAIQAAAGQHFFLSVTKDGVAAIVKTQGNDACHVILRGGKAGTNYDAASIESVVSQLATRGLPASVMVDCSHGNSLKDYRKQPAVAEALAEQISAGSRAITGVMIESHLVEGRQDAKPGQPLTYGQSITDACVNWAATEKILDSLAAAVRARRG